jgi:hypothetical protein
MPISHYSDAKLGKKNSFHTSVNIAPRRKKKIFYGEAYFLPGTTWNCIIFTLA